MDTLLNIADLSVGESDLHVLVVEDRLRSNFGHLERLPETSGHLIHGLAEGDGRRSGRRICAGGGGGAMSGNGGAGGCGAPEDTAFGAATEPMRAWILSSSELAKLCSFALGVAAMFSSSSALSS